MFSLTAGKHVGNVSDFIGIRQANFIENQEHVIAFKSQRFQRVISGSPDVDVFWISDDAATFKQVVLPMELFLTILKPQLSTSQIFSSKLAKPRQTERAENCRRNISRCFLSIHPTFHSDL
jgi:hypothetical protein